MMTHRGMCTASKSMNHLHTSRLGAGSQLDGNVEELGPGQEDSRVLEQIQKPTRPLVDRLSVRVSDESLNSVKQPWYLSVEKVNQNNLACADIRLEQTQGATKASQDRLTMPASGK